MIRCPLTPEQFADASAKLQSQEGIELTGTTGEIERNGAKATWSYDGETLTITVTHHPLFVTTHYCENAIAEALQGQGFTADVLG